MRKGALDLTPLALLLLRVNLLGFLIAFALLGKPIEKSSADSALLCITCLKMDGDAPVANAAPDAVLASDALRALQEYGGEQDDIYRALPAAKSVRPCNCFANCSFKKARQLKKLFVKTNNTYRKLVTAEFNNWLPSFNTWTNTAGLPGLMKIARQVVRFDQHNLLIPPATGLPNLNMISESDDLKRYVLQVVSDSAGGRLEMMSKDELAHAPATEICSMFRGLEQVLADVAYHLLVACETDTNECLYPELLDIPGNITVLDNGNSHPLGALIMLSWIDSQISVDPSGSGMQQREELEKDLLKLKNDQTITLHGLMKHLDSVKQRVLAIIARDPQEAHSTNVSAQDKFNAVVKAVARRAENSSDDKVQNSAESIKAHIIMMENDAVCLSIHDYQVKLSSYFSRHLPPAPAVEYTEATGSKSKRARTESTDTMALATVLTKFLQGAQSGAANTAPPQQRATTPKKNKDGNDRRQGQKRQGSILGTPEQRPSWWVCRKCLGKAHDSEFCPNPQTPEPALSLFREAVQASKAESAKQSQRQNALARNANKKNALPVKNGNVALGADFPLANFPFTRQIVPIDSEDDNEDSSDDTGNFAMADQDNSPCWWTLVGCVMAITLSLMGSLWMGVPLVLSCVFAFVTAGVLSVAFPVTMLLLAKKTVTTTCGLHMLLMIIFFLANLDVSLAASTTSFAGMVNSSSASRVWIDSGCNRTLFRDKDLLVNVRKISPRSVGGAKKGSRMICHYKGDYPLVLQDASGGIHLRLVRDVLISEHTTHNLLSLHDLRDVDVGFTQEPDRKKPIHLSVMTPSGTVARFVIKPINRLYPVPRWNLTDYPLGEVASSSIRSFAGSVSVQQRPLKRDEVWHHRLGHAHPSKIAKLSHNCIGIDKPIADSRHPCHTCMDANIRRNRRPDASTEAPDGTWNLDLMDMGHDTRSMAGFRYISIFTIVRSRFVIIILHKSKGECPEILRQAFAKAGKTPCILRTDGAGEYNSAECNKLLLDLKITKQTSNAEEQFQNGMVETMVNAIGKGIRAALLSSNLPPEFWGFAAVNWVDIYNHLPHSSLDDLSPWEVEKGTKPDVSMFRPFGCRVTVFRGRDKVPHHKISARGEPCVFLGLGSHAGHKGWVCYSPELKRVYCTRNCSFDETFMPMRTHDQRILGFFDTTPRKQMNASQHGDPDIAADLYDEIMDMDLPDNFDEDLPDDSSIQHQEADSIMTNCAPEDTTDSDDESSVPAKRRKQVPTSRRCAADFFSGQRSGGSAQNASTSGGSAQTVPTSGGSAQNVSTSGGCAQNASTSGGSAATSAKHNRVSNTPNAPAGGNQRHTGGWDDSFDVAEIGHKLISKATDAEVCDWLAAHGIIIEFSKRFFKHAPTNGPFQGIILERTAHKTPKGKVWLLDSAESVGGFPISTNEHSNSIRNALRETYPHARTLQDLKHTQENATDEASTNETQSPQQTASTRKQPERATRKPSTISKGTKAARFALNTLMLYLGLNPDVEGTYRDTRKNFSRLSMNDQSPIAQAVALMATSQLCMQAHLEGHDIIYDPPEPKTQAQAWKRKDADMWIGAEQKELETLCEMGTFLVVDKPKNYDPLPLQFVYKLKVKDGDFEHCVYKARLVVRGDLQYEHEYGSTYAPTAKLWTIRTLVAIAAQGRYKMKKFDLTGAFLVADMDRELYVDIPGYSPPEGKAFMLKKALYGGKSSGALYAKEISKWLTNYGFVPTTVDSTLYKLDRNGEVIYLSLYVDDGACCTNSDKLYEQFIKDLSAKYRLSDQGDLDWHLGMKFTYGQDGSIKIDQRAYIENVLKRFNMEDCKPKYTPMIAGQILSTDDCPKCPHKDEIKMYQQLIGSLMYISCGTRPDIAYAVNSCAQFMSNPGPTHVAAAKHILRYLKAFPDVGITYKPQTEGSANRLFGYVDADHASDKDDRKSVGGHVLMLNGGAICWSSRKIKVIALSSFESEWYSASLCGCEVTVVRRLLEEIGFNQDKPTTLYEDNMACIYASKNEKDMHNRTKHIDVRVFKLREFVENGTLALVKIDTQDQVADCLTKPLPREGIEMARKITSGELSEKLFPA